MHGSLAEAFGQEVPPTCSLRDLLLEGADKNPQGTAAVCLHQSADHLQHLTQKQNKDLGHLSWTYNDLVYAAGRLATIFHGNGVRKGSVIAVFLWNSIEWCLFLWATAGLGASFVPLDPRSINRPAELRHILQLLGVNVLVLEDADTASTFEKNAGELTQAINVRIVCKADEESRPDGWQSLSELHDDTPLDIHWRSSSDADSTQEAAVILFTSGTTSLPKACAHSAANLGSQTHSYSTVRLLDSTSKVLLHSPSFHIAGFWNLLCAWRAGATLVVPSRRFGAGASLKAVRSESCTNLTCTPSMLYAMFDHHLFSSQTLASLRLVGIGAEMVSPDLVTNCKNILGSDVIVHPGWGMSEGISLVNWIQNDSVTSRNGVSGIGRVMPGSKIRICEAGTQTPLKRGETGELHCSGTSMIRQYFQNSAKDAFYDDEHGTWFVTGDQATMDDSGVVYVLGRYKDIIIRGGENISPATIESCVNSLGGIKVFSPAIIIL